MKPFGTPRIVTFALATALLSGITGCGGGNSRIVGKWEGTLEGKPVKIEFTSAGKFRAVSPGQKEDEAPWEDWAPGDDKGKKTSFTFRGKPARAMFRGENEFQGNAGSLTMQLKREGTGGQAGDIAKGGRPDKEYVFSYIIVIMGVAIGITVICRPGRRENEPKWPTAHEEVEG